MTESTTTEVATIHDSRVALLSRPGGVGLLFAAASLWLLLGGSAFALIAGSGAPGWLVALVAGLVWMLPPVGGCIVLLNARMRVEASEPGVRFREWGRESFVSYRDIDDVRVDAKRIAIRLRGGKVRYVQLVGTYNMTDDPRGLAFSRILSDSWNRARSGSSVR